MVCCGAANTPMIIPTAAFDDKFSVDLSGFDFREYFGPEAGFNPFVYAYWFFFKREKISLQDITLRDLENAVNEGRFLQKSA